MIDLENDIFNSIATVLRANHSGVFVAGEYVPSPSSFPCVTIEQKDNTVVNGFRSSSGIENIVNVMFEVNVYSNKDSGKKAEAKSIMNTVDGQFSTLGFSRTMLSPIPNLADATIYRLTARYQANIGDDGTQTGENYIIYNN